MNMPASSRKASPQQKGSSAGSVQYINPDGMLKNPGFTQAVAASGSVKTVYVGAQTPVDANGTLIGKGDIAAQTLQVLSNVETCLRAAGAGPEHIVHWNIYVVKDPAIQAAFEASMRWWGSRPNPPANSVMFVAGFPWLPEVLIAIDAVAVVPL
jgi:enamine deaminase RidA (YjgF/YER057c/UK114 family)